MAFDEHFLEQAQQQQQAQLEQAIAARRQDNPAPEWIDGVPHCAWCGCGIEPAARAEAGWGTCIPCREDFERNEKRGIA